MTHESFLAATVLTEDGPTARAILCGVTESRERHYYTRVQHYKPQNSATQGLSTIKQLQKERRPTAAQWHELHQILAKQPSVVQVRTDITEEAENVMNAAAMEGGEAASASSILASKPCALRWVDMPDPPSPQRPPSITQRRVVDIDDPRAASILVDNGFGLQSDLIEESYCWWLEGIEYSLTRMFVASLNPDPMVPQQVPNPGTLQPVGNFWILYVRAKVDSFPAATMPDRVKQAQAQLRRVQEQFRGVFDFPVFDRRCHDTRAPP
ncbi:mediator complex, subunit Med18 [Chaetomium fimeti]|uniref:Mediator of RNA polymerase II transcription subunit 18 n=1 Tax=Chaetomium fimeti TaxID=1854472 RepID=A0AAE0LV70_9PEZI|nr:mediator complex, subunit Med18 [Chaetomium fimeti]